MSLGMHKIESYIGSQDKPIAFVLSIDITGLGIIRSLGRRGIPVIGLDPDPGHIGRFSRYCEGIVCPEPMSNEEEYTDFLLKLGEQLNTKGVLLPTADKDVLVISKHRDRLEKYYLFPMAKLDTIDNLVNKGKFYATLDKLNMPHPKTFFPDDSSDVERIAKEITYPSIVKPKLPHEFKQKFGTKLFKADSEEELVGTYKRARLNAQETVIQEVIPGKDTDNYIVEGYFNRASEVVGIVTYRIMRQYPAGFGTAASCVSVWVPEIAALCTSFLKEIKYHGIMNTDIRKDSKDNTFKLIEVNARVGLQNRLAARCGIDLPYMAYLDAIGQDIERVTSQKEGVKWLYLFDDLRSSLRSMSKGELSFVEYIRSLRGEKAHAIFCWDDLLPFVVSLSDFCTSLLRFLARHSASCLKSIVRRCGSRN